MSKIQVGINRHMNSMNNTLKLRLVNYFKDDSVRPVQCDGKKWMIVKGAISRNNEVELSGEHSKLFDAYAEACAKVGLEYNV